MKRFITFFFHPKDNSRFKDIRKYCIRDSIKTSLIVGPAVTVAVFLFLLISLIWPDSYGQGGYLKTYRVLYLCILLGLMLYELTLIFVDRYFDAHYSKIPVINVGAAVLLILWSIRITMLDYASYGRIDATLYMVISFCIPFCLYMDARMYFMMTVASDIVMVALFLNEGVDAAFNKSNLGDFLVFIGIHFILGLAAMYFKYNMREQLLEQEDQKEEIRQLNQAQSRFFSNMSHEIRTPINTIIGLNEIILRENASEEINEDAENIQAASKMLLNLINDILDMSKFESGQMKLAESAYQTGNMLSDIVGMLWIRAKEKNLEFHIDISPDLPSELYGDEMRIKQILINILNNAIKYTEKGRIRLAIQCRREGDGTAVVTYSVSDTGMGIRSESIPYLFTAFKRVDEEKNHYIEGTGLGLSIVKQLVDLMGGKITVNSVYTKGSTFVIEIPQRIINDEHIGVIDMEKKRSGRIDHKHVDPFRAESAKVLVVDDTTANLMVVEKLLKGTGVQLTKATSGYEALRLTMEEAYNVILMDHKMPGMDGIECMHQIRKQTGGLSNYARIIALTANAGENVEQLYEREGFDGYLTKPVSGEELEYTLYRNLPKDMITFTGSASSMARESMAWISSHRKKVAVRITTDSVADVPVELLKKYDIAEILHMVRTKDGLFKDRLEIDTNGLLAYMEDKSAMVETVSPSVEDYESFFS